MLTARDRYNDWCTRWAVVFHRAQRSLFTAYMYFSGALPRPQLKTNILGKKPSSTSIQWPQKSEKTQSEGRLNLLMALLGLQIYYSNEFQGARILKRSPAVAEGPRDAGVPVAVMSAVAQLVQAYSENRSRVSVSAYVEVHSHRRD